MEIIDTQDLEVVEETTANENEKEEKLFSQDEVNNIVQKRIDREMKKYKTDLVEAEKLAKMSESDRWKLELEKEREQFLQEKAEFQKAQLESQALKLLASKKLPSTFVDFIVADTAEQVADNITNLENVWQEALNDAVTAKIGGRTPNTSNTQGFKGIQSLKEFGALSYKERAKLLEEDSELLNKLK